MLPRSCLVWRRGDGEVVPGWLGEADEPWLRDVLEALDAADGKTQREVIHRIREAPRQLAPSRKINMVSHVLVRAAEPMKPAVSPRTVRAQAFGRAHEQRRRGSVDRVGVLDAVSADLHVDAEQVLFANIPAERRLAVPRPLPSPRELRAQVNLALAQGLVRRATRVQIDVREGARDVARSVHLRRLLCVARRRPDGGTRFDVSGVCSLFRRTTLYGRALASLVPRLAWCGAFELRAWCLLDDEELLLRLGHCDGLAPSRAPKRYDSKLEARFARDLASHAPEWGLAREPEALQVGDRLVFPDFALEHLGRRWLVEIVGFWTPEYLARKLETLRGKGVLLCIDRKLACTDEETAGLPVVWFRNRLDPAAVIRALADLRPCSLDEVSTEQLRLGDYFIDFAGRQPPSDAVHERLRQLRIGDVVELRREQGRGAIVTGSGVVALLSGRSSQRWLQRAPRVRAARVVGLVERRREQSDAAYRQNLRVDRWLIPLVEIDLVEGTLSGDDPGESTRR